MKKFTKEQLELILKKHVMWLKGEVGGEKANLSYADLRFADLRSANLRSADLSSADLSSANLSYADLRSANLRSADLSFANLRSADLSSANLRSADLRSADLRSADLSYADLRFANLHFANLRFADLSSADLLVFQFQRHQAIFTFDKKIRIGCHYLEIKEWVKKFKVIGKKEQYTKEEIDAYGVFIKLCAKLQKSYKKGAKK